MGMKSSQRGLVTLNAYKISFLDCTMISVLLTIKRRVALIFLSAHFGGNLQKHFQRKKFPAAVFA